MASWLDGIHLFWNSFRQSKSRKNTFPAASPLFVLPRRKEKILYDIPCLLEPARTTPQYFLSKAPQSSSV
ncbi:MAG TPA: hypothetical protein VHV10_17615 [Ktedonobacteraceae bacterium]|nr:hypothetical protein [Ktedonobacteraceae bacterium]